MKFTRLSLAGACAAGVLLAGCQEEKVAEPSLDTVEQKVSYSIGHNFAGQVSGSGLALDVDALKLGIEDAIKNVEPRLSQEEIAEAQKAMMEELQAQQQKEFDEKAESNTAEGEAFLAENANKDGVKQTDSGLQYEVLTKGEGPLPTKEDTVKVHYKGTLIDGTEFDSSYRRGQPAEFPLTAVIPGWTEALQLMPVGSKYKLAIPSDLAYGPGGAGPNSPIGPNSTLIFEVELLEIVSQ